MSRSRVEADLAQDTGGECASVGAWCNAPYTLRKRSKAL